jgi:hypothetical protein
MACGLVAIVAGLAVCLTAVVETNILPVIGVMAARTRAIVMPRGSVTAMAGLAVRLVAVVETGILPTIAIVTA